MSLPIFSEGGARAGDTPSHGVPFRKRESHTSAEAGALDAQLRYPFVHAQPGSAPSLQGFPSAGHAGGKGPSTCPACGANVVELRADLEMMQQDRESAVRRLGLDIGLCGMQPFETEVVRLRDVVAKMEESAKCVADAREEEAADRAREVADYDKRLQREEQARQDLEREVRLVRRERDASAAGARHVASDIGEVGAEERRRVAIRIKRLEEQLEGECEKHLKVQGSVKQLEALCTQLEADKGVLAEQAEELSADLEILENEVAELQVLNKTLRQIVDDKEVQVAAMQRYEVEFDHRMSLMVEERDQRLALVERQRETALLRVQELLEEGRKPPGPDDNNMEALSHLVRDKQLEIEDMADHIEELEVQLVNLQHVPTPEPDTTRRSELERHERHVADLKSDAADKDQRIIDLEKKLAVLVEGGSQELLRLNLVLERQLQVMRREVATVKTELSVFLSETADIVHENELLRSLQEVELGEFDLKLKEFKLKDKVTSAKAVALQKQLEDEVAELEEERSKLKRQVRRMSQLAVEKVSVFHDLLPQQVLQLEDIAESLRRGQLELPITDESRELRRTKKELEQRLKEKDQEIIENVSEKVKEYLQNCEGTGVELRVAELEKEKEALREANAALQLNAVKLEQATFAQEEQMANQVAREVAQQIVQHSFQPQVPTDLIDQFAAQVAILERSVQTCKGQGQPGEDKAVGSSVPATPGTQTTGTPSARGAQLAAQCGIVAALTPAVPTGTPSAAPRATPPFVLPGTQLPRELADGSPETIAVLYCQVINCMEELRREQSMTSALTSEVDTYRHKFEAQIADQEVMHGDYFIQRDTWERERRELKDCLASQGEIHETSNLHQRELWHREQLELNEEIASHGTALASVKLELESHRTQILQEQNLWEQRLQEERQRQSMQAEPQEEEFKVVLQRLAALEEASGRATHSDDAKILQMIADVNKAKSDGERELAEERARVRSLAHELESCVEKDVARTPSLVAVACGASVADFSSDSVVLRHPEAKSDAERELAEERARVRSLANELENRVERDAARTRALVDAACGASVADFSSDSVVLRHNEAKSDGERELEEERARVRRLTHELENRVERDAARTPALFAVACGASVADFSSDSVVLRHPEVEEQLAHERSRIVDLELEVQMQSDDHQKTKDTLQHMLHGESEAALRTKSQEEQFQQVVRTQQEQFLLRQQVVSEDFEARELALRTELSSKEGLFRSTERELRAKIQSLKERFSSRMEEIKVQTEAFKRAVASNEDDVEYHRSLAEQRTVEVGRLESGLQACRRHADEMREEFAEQRQEFLELESERDKHSEAAVRQKHKELQKLLIGKHQQLDKFKTLVEQLKDQVVRLDEEKAQTEIEMEATRKSETETRKQARSQKEQLRHAKEQVMRLTEQLREQRRVSEEVGARASKQASRTKELQCVLDEAGLQLVTHTEESQRAEEAFRTEHRRAEEAEEALRAERSSKGVHTEGVQDLVDCRARAEKLQLTVDRLERELQATRVVTSNPSLQDRFQEEIFLRGVTETRVRDLMEQLENALGQVERLRQENAVLRDGSAPDLLGEAQGALTCERLRC